MDSEFRRAFSASFDRLAKQQSHAKPIKPPYSVARVYPNTDANGESVRKAFASVLRNATEAIEIVCSKYHVICR